MSEIKISLAGSIEFSKPSFDKQAFNQWYTTTPILWWAESQHIRFVSNCDVDPGEIRKECQGGSKQPARTIMSPSSQLCSTGRNHTCTLFYNYLAAFDLFPSFPRGSQKEHNCSVYFGKRYQRPSARHIGNVNWWFPSCILGTKYYDSPALNTFWSVEHVKNWFLVRNVCGIVHQQSYWNFPVGHRVQ